jgi:membrane-associated phospholipid phosphatase
MRRWRVRVVLTFCLILMADSSLSICFAQELSKNTDNALSSSPGDPTGAETNPSPSDPANEETMNPTRDPDRDENAVGLPFLKHLVSDQRSIWTSPSRLRWADGTWLFPLAAATAGFLATDKAVPPALTKDPSSLNRYVKISDYGLYSLIGAGGGLFLWSKISHDDHQRETGILAAEAAINGYATDTALKYAFGRERPYLGQGQGDFFDHGDSFPSDHAALAWSIASVIAHEYPGPLTQIAAYGLATAVSASRVMGEQHFPSDVVVGAAIGWLIGRAVYRAHHDPDLPGAATGDLASLERRDRHHMGTPSVPLDSWVYPALERLAALQVITTELMGLKPWSRLECARLVEEASETLQQQQVSDQAEASRVETQLLQEFSREIGLLSGGHNLTANLESLYARAVSISGPALTDSYHFGQTLSDDFGRPFERGTNGQAGGSFSAAAGPLTLYVRAEYQHAPSAPAPSMAELRAIITADDVLPSKVPAGPIATINRLQLLDTYAGVNLGNWQLTIGKQSLSWTPGPDGSMLWSDNIDPVPMVRLVNPEPIDLPSFLKFLGPVRIDQFFGRLEGHPYDPRPFEYGQKVSVKPFRFLELGFARTVTIGGQGDLNAFTTGNLLRSFFGIAETSINSVPGDDHSEMDWTFYIPKVRNYIVLYGDAYADDDIVPIENPARNPWHPGIFITRFPGIPKLDLHVEGVSTEQQGLAGLVGFSGTNGNRGEFNYWNNNYPDGYTNGGNLIGNSVGRDGRAIQGWLTYWISPRNSVQFLYRHNTVNTQFIPGGGAWQDYSLQSEWHMRSGAYAKTRVQYEHISRYPVLYSGPQNNVMAIIELGFLFGNGSKE